MPYWSFTRWQGAFLLESLVGIGNLAREGERREGGRKREREGEREIEKDAEVDGPSAGGKIIPEDNKQHKDLWTAKLLNAKLPTTKPLS